MLRIARIVLKTTATGVVLQNHVKQLFLMVVDLVISEIDVDQVNTLEFQVVGKAYLITALVS